MLLAAGQHEVFHDSAEAVTTIARCTYQFVVFVLYFQSGSDAVARVDEGFALGLVCDVVQKYAGYVHTHKHDAVGHQLQENRKENYKTLISDKRKQ